jgi:hypothetical protein
VRQVHVARRGILWHGAEFMARRRVIDNKAFASTIPTAPATSPYIKT